MLEQLISNIGVIGTALALFSGINVFFFKADDFFSKEFKEDVALWILCLEPQDKIRLFAKFFIQLFDKIFSKNQNCSTSTFEYSNYSCLRTFLRSCLSSILAITIITLLSANLGPPEILKVLFLLDENWFGVFMFAVFLNLIPDYFSLLETRYILQFIEGSNSSVKIIFFLIIDLVLTILIFVGVGLILLLGSLFSYYGGIPILEFTKLLFVDNYWQEIIWIRNGGGNQFGIFFYSTFLTSIWIWFFGVSYMFLSLIAQSGPAIKLLKYILPIEDKPFRSIGIVSGLIALIIYFVTIFFYSLA